MPSALRVRWAKFRVMAVSLVALLIVGTLVTLLTGEMLFAEKATLYLHIPDATGLARGSPVRVDGINIGKVREVRLTGSNEPARVVIVSMTVERKWLPTITSDSSAQISADTLVGDKFVDISTGTSAASIQPNGELTFRAQPDLMKTVDLNQFEQQLRSVDAVLADIEQGRSAVGQFVLGDEMYNDVLQRLNDFQRGLKAASDTTRRIGQVLYTDDFYRRVADPLLRLDQSLARLQSGQGAGGQLLRDSAQYEKLRMSAADARRSIAELRAGEFLKSDQMYRDWNRGVASLIQKVDDFSVTPLLNNTQVYDNLNGFAREMQKTVREFRENPRKFMRIKIF